MQLSFTHITGKPGADRISARAAWTLCIAAFVLLAAGRCATAANIASAWTSTEADDTRGAAWGDYNSDGWLDLAVANYGQPVRVYRNDANGTSMTLVWSAPVPYNTDNATCIAWGDYNGDGQPDLLVGNSGQPLRIWRNAGGGAFVLAWSSTETDFVRKVAWADFDGDGDLDFIVGNYNGPVRIYRNTGGAFAVAWTASSSGQTESIAVADMNKDGDLDFAVGNYAQAKTVYRNEGGMNFSIAWTSTETDLTKAIAWGDYNGDGYPDLLIGNSGASNRVYQNNGNGTFTSVWTSAETDTTRDVAWGDFDNDGDLDFIVGNYGEQNRIYRNDGGGAFALDWSAPSSDFTNSVAWGDFDKDAGNDLDFHVATLTNNQIFRNSPAANTIPNMPTLIAATDTPPGAIKLRWNAASDTQTAAALLTYDMKVGTTAGGCEVFCGYFGDAAPGFGNVGATTSYVINLATGTYYWSVRTVDSAFARSAFTATDSFIIDGSSPSAVTVSDGTGADIFATPSTTTLSANWTASTDSETPITHYWYSIGTTAGASNTVNWTDNGVSTNLTRGGLGLTNGFTYFITVKSENSAGLMSTAVSSDGQMSDTTKPSAPASVSDGTGTDIAYATSGTQLSANWAASTDGESGIRRYWYSIGTTAGASNTVTWSDNATSTAVTRNGLGLADGQIYYFNVVAENRAGLLSDVTSSNGQIVDASPPSTGGASVSDGPNVDINFASSSTTLSANWAGFAEPHTGITKYWYSIGTTAGASNTVSWTDNGAATSVTRIGLSLMDGQIYYLSVKAVNSAGLISAAVNSNGQTADFTAPVSASATVYDGPSADLSFATSATTLSANWSGFTEPHTSIAHYWYAIGTTSGNTDVATWTDNGVATNVTRGSLSLSEGQTYYFTVMAESPSGLQSIPVSSNGQKVDTSAPATIATVNDGAGADIAFSSSITQLRANWTASSDTLSGIKKYWYSIGTTAGASDTAAWTDNGASLTAAFNGSFTNGQTYYTSVKAENNGGLMSTPSVSNGQKIDTTPPSDPSEVRDGVASDTDYIPINSVLSANWPASVDAESGIARYWYAVGTSSGASNTIPWTDNATATSFTRTGLGLTNGQVYYTSIKSENNAGILSSPIVSDGQIVDVTAPDVVTVNDGAGVDVDFADSLTQLSSNWTVSTDAQSGIARYWYSIGTTAGASDTAAWTDNATATTVTRNGLSLTEGQDYYFTVKAENGSGLISTTSVSDGQRVDTSPPSSVALVNDGTAADAAFATSAGSLSANWPAAADVQSGITHYWYSIGTTSGASDTAGWTDNGTALFVTRGGLTLTDGQAYYFNVKAQNGGGLISATTSSNGQLYDTSAPTGIAFVYDGIGSDITYTTATDTLSANWAATDDANSGLARYWYSVGTTAGASDVVQWTDNGFSTSVARTDLSLLDGQAYYFAVKAENSAGLQTPAKKSNGVTKDSSPPTTPAYVNDGLGADLSVTIGAGSLSANWAASSDSHTALSNYYYSIGTTPGNTDVKGWTATTSTQVTVTSLSLHDGISYYFNVKARNAAGLESGIISSNGAAYNSNPPTVSFSAPTPGQQVTGTVDLMGTASDFSMNAWGVYYGVGAAPTAWILIASGSTNVQTGLLAHWDTSALSGAYTLRIRATDTLGGIAETSLVVSIGNTNSLPGTAPANQWVQNGMPVQPSPADPISVFGTTGEYKVMRWDPTAADDPDLQKYRAPHSLNAGYGYWLMAYSKDFSYSIKGSPVDTTRTYSLPVYAGWNQICSPFNRDYPWSQVRVKTATGTYDMTTAADQGIISSVRYAYDSGQNGFVQKNISDPMVNREGYFVRVWRDAELLFDPGASLPKVMARLVRPVFDFRVRISASGQHSSDTDNYFGSVATADGEFDPLDAPDPPRAPQEKFTVLYFPHSDWTRNGGRFADDFRPLIGAAGGKETWEFNVETNETDGPMSITWDAASLPVERFAFTLVNIDTGERVNMASQTRYVYTAGAAETRFSIETVKREAALTSRSHVLRAGWNLISAPLEPDATSASIQLVDNLASPNVYQYFDGAFYEARDADIQAGIGFWAYSATDAAIDVTGTVVPADQSIRMPLKAGWNLLGNPFDQPLTWGDNIQVEAGDSVMTLSEAAAAGILSETIYTFEGGGYSPLAYGAAMQPWSGYAVKAQRDATIIMKH